jgi:hypothetical protein
MWGMWPWGGFGANPRPHHWQSYWDSAGALLDGFFPYSEGIFEDLNKVMLFQWGWTPERDGEDIIREYAASCFAPGVAGDVLEAVLLMEQDHEHRATAVVNGEETGLGTVYDNESGSMDYELRYRTGDLTGARACYDLLSRAHTRLPVSVREGWRWRVLWLRAALDVTLAASGGKPTVETDACMEELARLYHADRAEPSVRPPARTAGAARE